VPTIVLIIGEGLVLVIPSLSHRCELSSQALKLRCRMRSDTRIGMPHRLQELYWIYSQICQSNHKLQRRFVQCENIPQHDNLFLAVDPFEATPSTRPHCAFSLDERSYGRFQITADGDTVDQRTLQKRDEVGVVSIWGFGEVCQVVVQDLQENMKVIKIPRQNLLPHVVHLEFRQ
jgi:hypothetical protein